MMSALNNVFGLFDSIGIYTQTALETLETSTICQSAVIAIGIFGTAYAISGCMRNKAIHTPPEQQSISQQPPLSLDDDMEPSSPEELETDPIQPTDKELQDLLWDAAIAGKEEVVRDLLDRGVAPNPFPSYNLFALVAGSGHTRIIELLAEKGANLNAPCSYSTPLDFAIDNDQHEIAKYLISKGAKPRRYGDCINYDLKSKNRIEKNKATYERLKAEVEEERAAKQLADTVALMEVLAGTGQQH